MSVKLSKKQRISKLEQRVKELEKENDCFKEENEQLREDYLEHLLETRKLHDRGINDIRAKRIATERIFALKRKLSPNISEIDEIIEILRA